MAVGEELVLEEFKKFIDPELFLNIVDLGLIYNVEIADGAEGKKNVKIDMTMTSPMCPAGPQMIANSKQVLGLLPDVGNVEVKIVLDPPWSPDKMSEAARDQLGIF
jgi:metal-sulfur cluster biosynthetic enzyme